MASPAPLRNSTDRLVGYASRDLSALFNQVSDAAQAKTALMDVLPALIETYGTASAALASTWYDEARAKASVRGRFESAPIAASDRGAQALVGWATTTTKSDDALKTLLLGGIQRRIADHSRMTIMSSSIQDPRSSGWQRVGDGDTCSFCAVLLGRGFVYTEESADFQTHDHCGCWAEPEFT